MTFGLIIKDVFLLLYIVFYELINLGVPENHKVVQYCRKVSYLKISKDSKTVFVLYTQAAYNFTKNPLIS